MTWFRVDDKWLQRAEVQGAGLHGRALWLAVGATHCAGEDTDGMIDGRVVKMLAAAAEVNVSRATTALVEQGLWHDAESIEGCPPCLEVAKKRGGLRAGDFFHHAFLETNLDQAGKHDALVRHRDLRRRKIRKDAKLKGDLRTRDRDECQYCGTPTRWVPEGQTTSDRKSKDLGEIDHVDPWGPDYSPCNLVVACKGCNSAKSDRNPLQWHADGGHLLRRPIDAYTDPTWVDPTWADHG